MKHLATILFCAALAVPTIHAAALTKAQQSYFQNRRICVGRDTTTLPGYVITTWHRNGRPDTKGPAVVTNELKKIVGREQTNPLQADAKITRDIRKAARKDSKNLAKLRKDLEKYRDKAATEAFAELCSLLLELLPEGE